MGTDKKDNKADTGAIRDVIRSATAAVDREIVSEADWASDKVKFAVWLAALGAGGISLLLLGYEKLGKTWLMREHPNTQAILFVATCCLFGLSLIASATLQIVLNRFVRSVNAERTLIQYQAVMFEIHHDVIAIQADAEALSYPGLTRDDVVFLDILRRTGGSVAAKKYHEKFKPMSVEEMSSDWEGGLARERLGSLSGQLNELGRQLTTHREARQKHERFILTLSVMQGVFVAAGFLFTILLAVPARP